MVTGRRVDIDGFGMLYTVDRTTNGVPGDGNPPDIRGMGSFNSITGPDAGLPSEILRQISNLPSTTSIPLDCWNITKDATGGGIYIAANDGGVIKKLELQLDGTGANLVTSVFGRIGDVVAQVGDYNTANMSVNMGIGAGGTDASGFNVSIGTEAGFSITSGAANVNIGFDAGWNTTTAQAMFLWVMAPRQAHDRGWKYHPWLRCRKLISDRKPEYYH
jgi:hypothetical protein